MTRSIVQCTHQKEQDPTMDMGQPKSQTGGTQGLRLNNKSFGMEMPTGSSQRRQS